MHLGMTCIYSKDPSLRKNAQFDWSTKHIMHVLSSLKYPHGSVRIIIATSALGRVINYGPPNNIDAYVQAFGRVGRVSLSWSSTSTL